MAGSDKQSAGKPEGEIPPEAKRALKEAAERRRQTEAQAAAKPKVKEIGGPEGPDPTRYGDWERKGIASDF